MIMILAAVAGCLPLVIIVLLCHRRVKATSPKPAESPSPPADKAPSPPADKAPSPPADKPPLPQQSVCGSHAVQAVVPPKRRRSIFDKLPNIKTTDKLRNSLTSGDAINRFNKHRSHLDVFNTKARPESSRRHHQESKPSDMSPQDPALESSRLPRQFNKKNSCAKKILDLAHSMDEHTSTDSVCADSGSGIGSACSPLHEPSSGLVTAARLPSPASPGCAFAEKSMSSREILELELARHRRESAYSQSKNNLLLSAAAERRKASVIAERTLPGAPSSPERVRI